MERFLQGKGLIDSCKRSNDFLMHNHRKNLLFYYKGYLENMKYEFYPKM